MKQVIKRFSMPLALACVMLPATLLAQSEKEEKGGEQIIITRKGSKDDKLIVEVNGDKVTVNGKDVKDYSGDIRVSRNKIRDINSYRGNGTVTFSQGGGYSATTVNENRAMLGVSTEKVDEGAEVIEVTKESAAEKMGLKKGDVITRIDEAKIETPDDLSEQVRKHKPGEKVSVTYLRDKKETKATGELTKWKGVSVYNYGPGEFNMDLGDLNMNLGKIRSTTPRMNFDNMTRSFNWSGSNLKLGLSVQDTDDGKGVKVIEADDEGNAAKAGIKENDIILDVDGKEVNGADEIAKIIRESREKVSVTMKLMRNGKQESVVVKIPRRLKTADL